MKSFACCVLLALLVTLTGSAGCSKKITVDTTQLEYSVQTADDATQKTVNEALEAIDKADYTSAAEKLKQVSANPKLTAEQKTAVNGVISQIEKH